MEGLSYSKKEMSAINRRTLVKNFKRDKELVLIMIIPLIYYLVFHYGPMYGILIAFKDFSPTKGIMGSDWVGLDNFIEFFQSRYFFRVIRNTFLLSAYNIIFGFPIPIIFSLFLNEIRQEAYKRVIQSVSYLPHFISTVVVVGMMVNFLSPNGGLVNNIVRQVTGNTINFMEEPSWFRFLYVSSSVWASFGFSSIIYIAAISGIDPTLYEAAIIDGANRLQKILYITIPSILPTIIILLILRMGSILNVGFEKVILMYSGSTYEVADIISSYSYRVGLVNANYSYGAAIGFFNTVVNFIFILLFNWLSKKYTEVSLW